MCRSSLVRVIYEVVFPWTVKISGTGLMVSSCPFEVGLNGFIFLEFIQGVEFPAQIFFRKFFMYKRVAASADIDTSLTHIFFVKMFFKPFVAMASPGNEVMESCKFIGTAEGTYLTHPCLPRINMY